MRQLIGNIWGFFQGLFGIHHQVVHQVAQITPTPTSAFMQQASGNLSTLPATGPSNWIWMLLILCLVLGICLHFSTLLLISQNK